MKRVTEKIETRRTAVAESVVKATSRAIDLLRRNDLPKKDVLPTARAAGVLAAKRTAELIPDCHPVPLDFVDVAFEVGDDRVRIRAEAQAVWKTGVEMEALTAASIAALTVYDMLKAVETDIEISSTKLIEKTGGKSSFKDVIPTGFRVAVLVTSDGTFAGKRQDKSGHLIEAALQEWGVQPAYLVLPDERAKIAEQLRAWCREGFSLILTTGGTGLGPRDVTVEATREVIEREIPGIIEAGRAYGQRRTPYAMLSRGLAGQFGQTLIVNLPGSSKGTEETLKAIFPYLLHAYPMMKGGGH